MDDHDMGHYWNSKKEDGTPHNLIMKSRSEEQEQSVDKLHHKLRSLEQEWDLFNQSNPHALRRRHHSSTDSNTSINTLPSLITVSPRRLLSSLQQQQGKFDMDSEREEILRERRAAIESGTLKGRRLFGASEGETETGSDLAEEEVISEVHSMTDSHDANGSCSCCSFSGSCLSDDKVERRQPVLGEGEKVGVEVITVEGHECGRWMNILSGWVTFVVLIIMVFALVIVSVRCNGKGYGYGDEVIPVPT